ncbi:MAG TPA: hypothetical protein VHB02_06265 [Acidimicrobiales bacterium]|nr:hypothetical protein [Acidimicrobiales bacterium]
MSTHIYRTEEVSNVRVFTADSGVDLGYGLTIVGPKDRRLAIVQAWAEQEGLRIAQPIIDDYGNERLVPHVQREAVVA